MEGAEYMSADTQTQCTVYAISAASRPMTVTAATSLGSSRRRAGPLGPDVAPLPPACARSRTRVKCGSAEAGYGAASRQSNSALLSCL